MAVATAAALPNVRTAMVRVPGHPFAVAVTADGRWAFVSLDNSVEVLRTGASPPPSRVHDVVLPGPAAGEALTRNGRYLLVASGSGAIVISVARAEQGNADAIVGTLASIGGGNGPVGGGIEVAVSPDDKFVFVTLESRAAAAVFNLVRALASGFGRSSFVGDIPLGVSPVGMAFSPDGRSLYATSELKSLRSAAGLLRGPGTLTVIDLHRAETDPAASIVSTVTAECGPVRVITSADGSDVWVTARESNSLLCFSAAALRSDPAHALIARVRVGDAPVGLVLVRRGTRIVVADSNRFGAAGASSDLDVVDVAAALAGRPAVIGWVSAGQFPREFALEAGATTLLVTNYASQQLEAVGIAGLP